MEYVGTVMRKAFAPASKSGHEAIWLKTDAAEYKLEREEGNPFLDPVLEELVGKRIKCSGQMFGVVLRIREWSVMD